MKKLIVGLMVSALSFGPLSAVANAGVFCSLQEKLGVNNVKECEDYWP